MKNAPRGAIKDRQLIKCYKAGISMLIVAILINMN